LELSRLARKEIINLYDGARLGFVGDSDLVIDADGCIQSMVIYTKGLGIKMGRAAREIVIPWGCVKKIGDEVMIVNIVPERQPRKLSCHE